VGQSRAVAAFTGSTNTPSKEKNKDIQWLLTIISIKCEEPRCACNTSRGKKPNNCPALEGKVHMSGDTQYVRALAKIFEAGGQPVKNRVMRSLTQKDNQAKFSHRMPGVQQSPVVHDLQHLRGYNSCRIWASQSRRTPYVVDVEGSARIEGVAASIHESYMDGHGNKVAEDAVFKTPRVVIIFDEAPRYQEVQSKSENKQPRMTVLRDMGGGPAAMQEETRLQTTFVVEKRP